MRIYQVYVLGEIVNKWYLLTWSEALSVSKHYISRLIKDVKIVDTATTKEKK